MHLEDDLSIHCSEQGRGHQQRIKLFKLVTTEGKFPQETGRIHTFGASQPMREEADACPLQSCLVPGGC